MELRLRKDFRFCKTPVSVTFASKVILLCLHDLVTRVPFDGMCATELRLIICLVPYVDDFLDVLQGDRVETENAAIERVSQLQVLLLRAVRVHMQIASWRSTFVTLVLFVRVCNVNCMSSSVPFEAAWCNPSCLMAVSFSQGQYETALSQKQPRRLCEKKFGCILAPT